MKATERNRGLAALERFTEEPNRFGAYRVAIGFPNSYEIGMSNLGFQWVYRLFNRVPDLVCERFFFEEGEPAVTFETGTPLSEFGLLAWSLSWEMDIVNIIKTLRAARIPARRAERGEGDPLVLIGGDIARMNPAALTTFADIFALGDGERLVPAIAELLRQVPVPGAVADQRLVYKVELVEPRDAQPQVVVDRQIPLRVEPADVRGDFARHVDAFPDGHEPELPRTLSRHASALVAGRASCNLKEAGTVYCSSGRRHVWT